jgi:EmrB/QacA subfamily drug resistance transporter
MAVAQLTKVNEITRRRRLGILVICCMSLLLVGLDTTIVNVALPSIGRDLHTSSVSELQWILDAYTVVIASLLMLSGATADRVGRKLVFRLGVGIFTLGSLLCSLAPSVGLLILFRMFQAVGGSMMNPVAMSIINNTFTDQRERAQAIGIWGMAVGVSMALGPVLGGVLVSSVGWRSVFWINIPVGIAAIILMTRYVPESKAPKARRPDPVAQILVVGLLGFLTFAIIEVPGWGWTSPAILASFTLTAASAAALIVWETRRREPLIDLEVFRSVPFSGTAVIAVLAFFVMAGFLLVNTLYLQDGRGLSPLHAGLDTLPMAAAWLVSSPVAGRLVGHRGPRLSLLAAGVLIAAAGAMLATITNQTSFTFLFAAYVLLGVGMGLVNPPISVAALSGMPAARSGVAAAIASSCRQVGGALGVAILGAIVAFHEHGAARAIAVASHDAWWVMAGAGLAIIALTFVVTSSRALATAKRVEPA